MARSSFPTSRPLPSVFAEIGERPRSILRHGSEVLGGVDPGKIKALLSAARPTFYTDTPNYRQMDEIASVAGVSGDDVAPLLSLVGLIANAVAERKETPEQFIQEAKAANLVESHGETNALTLARLVAGDREEIRRDLESANIVSENLPSLAYFEATVDLRLDFSKDGVRNAIPVAILHIDTDASNRELWFQASLSQAVRMKQELEETIRRLQIAESMAKNIVYDK